ncbi:class I SAM-dependent DNA methyltransferase [Pedobacter hartonius]|uniref:site-specific DNA-methyltransferase (adenine-specific) n=1 Tax=Pedobacter hartonius TaxID=425514 RepID=A0A1H4HG81_9SPHI|nr:DNA methyltransferase [Pedobacter hartonius]SEB20877.1 hypothetical protein SAMN05443550_1185 [Pedobacter hartonius]
MNAVEIEEAISLLAEQPFVAAEFPYAFLEAFGNKATTIIRLKTGNNNKSDVEGGVLQYNNIHIAVCDIGNVTETLFKLKESPATTKAKVKFILATDGSEFQAEDLNSGETVVCDYSAFHNYFGFFLSLAGISTVKQIREDAFDIKATSRLNKLYIELLSNNPEWATAERRHDMNHFLARLIFCFFAEDTDIFIEDGLFTQTVQQMSNRDASDTHEIISEIFRTMDIKKDDRAEGKVKNWAIKFPYVNGQLFSGSTETPKFTKIGRSYLLHVGKLDWKKVNPDIFGSMIQAVADEDERGALGMHYTSVPNILKVLNPLFLDDLKMQLEEAGDNTRKLLNLRKRISRIRIFDPACGSGNFLVIAYKQMREIEAEINSRRGEGHLASEIPLTNFRGIELRDFSCEIARLALIIAEYQSDVIYRGQKLALAEFLPLNKENWIVCGNSLRRDWLSLMDVKGAGVKLHADDLFSTPLHQSEINFENERGETYICGNPPYLGAKKKSTIQTEDMNAVGLGKAQLLDYVCAFIIKGLEVIKHTECGMALVVTSSICQGEQVSLLWPEIFKKSKLNFAYRPFKWANSAANNAGVWCTILGLEAHEKKIKRLFFDGQLKLCDNIAPYLIPGPDIICEPRKKPISDIRQMQMGSNPVDGKRLVLSVEEYKKIISSDPRAKKYLKKYGGTDEITSGNNRWCIWIEEDEVEEALAIPLIAERVEACRIYRETAGRDARKAAKRPYAFCYSTYNDLPFVNVGKVIGNSTKFVPATLRPKGFVSSDAAFTIYGTPLVEFSIIVSTLHCVWAETIAGRLGNGTRYGNTTAYNTFPVPLLTEKNKEDLINCAEEILIARERYFPATIADLYDSESMPEDLRRAHDRNDEVIDRIYVGRRFKNDTERLEKLFDLYTQLTSKRKA